MHILRQCFKNFFQADFKLMPSASLVAEIWAHGTLPSSHKHFYQMYKFMHLFFSLVKPAF